MNSSSFDRTLRQVLIVPIVIVLLGAAALAWQIHQANLTVARIQRADDAITESLLIERLILDEETGLRGFQITRDARFLDTYNNAARRLPNEFVRRQALALNPARRVLVEQLQTAHEAWREGFAEPVIANTEAGGQSSDVELNLLGKNRFEDMRAILLDLTATPERNRDTYVAEWRSQVRLGTVALIALALLIGLVIGIYTRRRLRDVSGAFHQANNVLRVRAEQTFRSEQKLRTTLQSIGDGVITCTADGQVDLMNDVAQQLTGWTRDEAVNLPIETIFPILNLTTREPLENPVSKVKLLNRVVAPGNHTILVRKDRSEIFIDDSGAPIRDEQGALMGVVLVFRDVTMALKSRDALLANEKLAVAGRLAATIAHEIHNPLDSVANLLYLMDGQSTPEENHQFLQLARQEIARVTQISRAMLSLYRESRAPVPIDIAEMLKSILLLMERRFSTLGVRIETNLPPHLVIQGFPAELRQVFTNILTNAAEASADSAPAPTGTEGLVQIDAKPCPATVLAEGLRRESGVLITVADSGPGIPEHILASLFQPFFTTKGERGTGLGLWISRGIITKHGGTIDLTSNTTPLHHGTTLTVFLATNPIMNAGGD